MCRVIWNVNVGYIQGEVYPVKEGYLVGYRVKKKAHLKGAFVTASGFKPETF